MAKDKRPKDVVGNAVFVARSLLEKMEAAIERDGEEPKRVDTKAVSVPAKAKDFAVGKKEHRDAAVKTVQVEKSEGKVRSGKAGAAARSASLTKEQRSDIARNAAKKRWDK